MSTRILFLLACLLPPALAAGVTSDVEYARAGAESLRLDASIPDGPGPFPAVIIVHGGGWMGGDKKTNAAPLFAPLSAAGFAWFSVNYRLAPAYRYPACLEDIESAIRWVKRNASSYRVDPSRLALRGESAGAHLVDMAAVRATEETRVAAVVSFYAPCDLVADTVRRGGPSKSMVALFGVSDFGPASQRLLHDASPLNFVSQSLPPFLLLHGTSDKSVPYVQSVQWKKALTDLDVPCDLITIDHAPHGMGNWESIDPTYKTKVVDWLRRRRHASPR